VRNLTWGARSKAARASGQPAVPVVCPSCQSSSIVTTAKSPGADSYWRCTTCGEIWNDTRRERSPYAFRA
jgi:predicted Zn finger-like uncharacterized protein